MTKNNILTVRTGILLLTLSVVSTTAYPQESDLVVISIVGTNDVHGELLPKPNRGGLTTLSGYVENLRATRATDGGAVLLIDAGDMWQGTLESNLTEGATIVAAYNALGYTAAAIGNHEFDFGPVGKLATPQSEADDPRGALKLRAIEADFPLLAANLIDTSTDEPVNWDNVQPSTVVDVAGVRVGIVGVITANALVTTMVANTAGLRIGSLSAAIIREAEKLRAAGASIIIVTAHAGGHCTEFGDPLDLSSCDHGREIVQVANALPADLVDHIIAGHVHEAMAHVVNGIAITSSYSSTRAFSRVDFSVDRNTGSIQDRKIFAPQPLCPRVDSTTGECAWVSTDTKNTVPAEYEGRPVTPLASILSIAERAAAFAAEIKMEKLGVTLDTPFTLQGNPESSLANLMSTALLESIDADIAIHNVSGGIRMYLPKGELTYGNVFEMFPFDNRIVVVDVSGEDLRKIIARQAHNHRRRAGFSGMRVFVDCDGDQMSIRMTLDDGRDIQDSDRIRIVANDFLTTGGDDLLTPAMPADGFTYEDDPRLTRDVVADWLRNRGGHLSADQFQDPKNRRWNLPDLLPATCSL